MKPTSRIPYALSVCAVAAMLTGCSGPGRLPNPMAEALPGNAGVPLSSSGSVGLAGTAKLGRCKEHYIHHGNVIVGEAYRTNFHAHGEATGPYNGTFVASGHWEYKYEFPLALWDLVENFTITSGTSTLSGTVRGGGGTGPFPTCTSFGPITYGLQYTTNYASGNAQVQIIEPHDFGETLEGL